MPNKVRTNITIDPEVLKKAQRLGLNVSKIAENAVKEYIRRLEGSSQQTETNGGNADLPFNSQVRTSACHADDPGSNPGGRTNFEHGFVNVVKDRRNLCIIKPNF